MKFSPLFLPPNQTHPKREKELNLLFISLSKPWSLKECLSHCFLYSSLRPDSNFAFQHQSYISTLSLIIIKVCFFHKLNVEGKLKAFVLNTKYVRLVNF